MLNVRDLCHFYIQGDKSVPILTDLNLEIPQGEFVCIRGTSGSGKSTLLRLAAGLESPTSGDIEIDGQSIAHMSDASISVFRRRHLGFIFQFFNLIPSLSVLENVTLPLFIEGVPVRTAHQRGISLLERVGLGNKIKSRLSELSGGEAQRVAIARALVIEPKLILADEPTGSLDSRTGTEILDLLRGLVEAENLTVLMATHDQKVSTYSDRILYLQDGSILGTNPAPEQ